MYYNFNTESLSKAKAALLLYAMYKSRDKNSPLNGLETWTRAESFCSGRSLCYECNFKKVLKNKLCKCKIP